MSHANRSRQTRRFGDSPTPAEIRAARAAAGDTQAQAARRVVSSQRSWEKWETELSGGEHRRMLPGMFKLYLILTGQPLPPWLTDAEGK